MSELQDILRSRDEECDFDIRLRETPRDGESG
jgi:hypothetical protein